MPKKQETRPPVPPTRKMLSRAQREQRLQHIVTIVTVVVAVTVVALLVFALVNEQFIKPQRPLVAVGSETITVADFEDNVKFGYVLRYGNTPPEQLIQLGIPFDPVTFSQDILNIMVDDLVIRQQAEQQGVEVTEADAIEQIQLVFGYDAGDPEPTATALPTLPPFDTATPTATYVFTPTVPPTATLQPGVTPSPTLTLPPTLTATPTLPPGVTPSPTPTLTPAPSPTPLTEVDFNTSWDEQIAQVADLTGLSQARVRQLWISNTRALMLRDEMLKRFEFQPATSRTMTHAAHILIRPIYPGGEIPAEPTDEEIEAAFAAAKVLIDEARARIVAGEPFEVVAAEVSEDPGNAYKGGDLGWNADGAFVTEFEDALNALEAGDLSEPVRTQFGWHIIQLYDRQEEPISQSEQDYEKEQAFLTEVEGWRIEMGVDIGDRWLNFVPSTLP